MLNDINEPTATENFKGLQLIFYLYIKSKFYLQNSRFVCMYIFMCLYAIKIDNEL